MKETARPDPLAAAQRVKGLARDVASELADGYRKSTRYFKLRAAVVGTWAILSMVTLWAACPSSGPANSLGAEVRMVSEGLLGAQVMVKNASDRNWTEVVLTLDADWRWEKRTIRSGDDVVVAVARFRKDGATAPGDLKPAALTVECEQGRVTTPLAARSP